MKNNVTLFIKTIKFVYGLSKKLFILLFSSIYNRNNSTLDLVILKSVISVLDSHLVQEYYIKKKKIEISRATMSNWLLTSGEGSETSCDGKEIVVI